MGNYQITFRSVEHSVKELTLGTAVPDQWNDLKYYVKNSEGNDGELKIWLNGELVYTYEGQTLYKRNQDGYFKFGMYTEFRDERILLFDGVRISNSLLGKSLEEWATDQQDYPSVELTSPEDDTQIELGSTIILLASAADPSGLKLRSLGGILSVSFYAGSDLLDTDTSAPFEYSWTPPAEGVYSLTAKAIDTDGNVAFSKVNKLVVGNRPPLVSMESPKRSQNLDLGQTTSITAAASDMDGSVAKVMFYVNGDYIGEDNDSPYNVNWTPTQKASYVVTARAVDNEGGIAEEHVAVTVGAEYTDVTLTSIKDAAIKSNYPAQNNNYGKVEILTRSYTIAGLFGFDLKGISGSNQEIVSASLKLTGVRLDAEMDLSIFAANGDWEETSVNWDTAPSRAAERLDHLLISSTGTYEFDVTSYVRQLSVDSAESVSFWVEDTSRSEKTLEINSWKRSPAPQLILKVSDVLLAPADSDSNGDNSVSPLDTIAPIFSAAATSSDGNKIILIYNEALSATTAAADRFTVTVDGSAAAISNVATSGSTVQLTLSSAITSGQTVTVVYTDPSSSNDTDAIQDTAGNDAGSLSSTIVTNNLYTCY